jgi:hypothetical protein
MSEFPKVSNPLDGVTITRPPKCEPVIWGASPWPRVTETQAVTKTQCEPDEPLQKLNASRTSRYENSSTEADGQNSPLRKLRRNG